MIVLPFNRCHDSSQYSPSSSLSASCSDSVIIFKRLADTAFSFFYRLFQPHFLIINIPAFVACAKCWPTLSKTLLCDYALLYFLFLVEANRQDLFLLQLMFSTQHTLRQRGNWYAIDLYLMSKHQGPLMSHDIFGDVDR